MVDKNSIILQKCTNARFVEVCEMHYVENGVKKRWEVVKSSDSVSILINNAESKRLIIVRQFRPAVFLRNNDGYMFELCAGLVDKKGKSLEQIAREEVFEECGYEAQNLVKIGEFYSSVGTSGSKQTVFYTQVCDADKKTKGGGVDDEFIEIVEIPHSEVLEFLKTPNITPSLGFAFMWFLQNSRNLAGNSSLGMQFRTCENFGESTDSSLVLSPKFSQIQKPHRNHFDFDSQSESPMKQTQNTDSAESQNLVKNNLTRSANLCKSFCYFWLLPKVESPLPLNPNLPNSADSATRAKSAKPNINFARKYI